MDNQLKRFAKGKSIDQNAVKTAVSYTRVSTKEQADTNQSLFTQKKSIHEYAAKHSIEIVGEFGGTYESAKTDERKEFKRMLDFAKRKKIDQILVYSFDRFSRSGPNAIYITESLKKAGIEVYSITQPTNTVTAGGELQQNIYFIFSQYDNMQRKEKCLAGIKEMLLRGEWPTKPPFGYEISRRNGKREVVINDAGRYIRQAFLKKIRYNTPFVELSAWLKSRDVNVHHKRLSEMSRNPFYCGFMSHNTLEGELAKGNHEPLLSETEFLQLNNVLASNFKDRKKKNKKLVKQLPLKGHLICSGCGCKLTGYIVRSKDLWYYKCNTNGCPSSKSAKSIHDLWTEKLSALQLDSKYAEPIKKQMRRTLDRTRALNMNDIEVLQKENLELQTKIDKLEERFAIGQINREIFEKYSNKYKLQQAPIQEELDKHAIPKSNHEELINGSIETLCNLVNIWKKADFETKGNFIKAIYPEGIVLDTENNQYLKLTI